MGPKTACHIASMSVHKQLRVHTLVLFIWVGYPVPCVHASFIDARKLELYCGFKAALFSLVMLISLEEQKVFKKIKNSQNIFLGIAIVKGFVVKG